MGLTKRSFSPDSEARARSSESSHGDAVEEEPILLPGQKDIRAFMVPKYAAEEEAAVAMGLSLDLYLGSEELEENDAVAEHDAEDIAFAAEEELWVSSVPDGEEEDALATAADEEAAIARGLDLGLDAGEEDDIIERADEVHALAVAAEEAEEQQFAAEEDAARAMGLPLDLDVGAGGDLLGADPEPSPATPKRRPAPLEDRSATLLGKRRRLRDDDNATAGAAKKSRSPQKPPPSLGAVGAGGVEVMFIA